MRHDPTIEFLIDGSFVGRIDVNVRIDFAFKGAIVKVDGGRIRAVRVAESSASVVLGIGGQDLHTEHLGRLQFPGTLTFDTPADAASTRSARPLSAGIDARQEAVHDARVSLPY